MSMTDCVAIYQKFKLNKRIQNCKHDKAQKLKVSISNPMDLLNKSADHDRQGQAAHRPFHTVPSNHAQWLSLLQVKAMHNDTHISAKYSAHDFIVNLKFSPSVCVAIVASLTREMTA